METLGFGKLRVLYQEVTQGNQVMNLPQLVTRNSLYFSKDIILKGHVFTDGGYL